MGEAPDEETAFKFIKSAPIFQKFKLYGFFKNLQFFEPFLLLIFLKWDDVGLFEIGMIFFVQELIIYIFEIPSGLLADNYGKKTELLLCFAFYITSFICFFFGYIPIFRYLGAGFYGLGEAFRSGTHKAMEFQWMERHNLLDYKSYIYGRTRSWSLYGSALNAVLSVVFVAFIPADRWIFLIAIIPFMLDFILIASYPGYMNEKKKNINKNALKQFKTDFVNIFRFFKDPIMRCGIISSSLYDALFKSLKDYIQPILKVVISALLITLALDDANEGFYIKLVLGIVYFLFYILSSFASKNAYFIIKKMKSAKIALDIMFDVFALFLLFEGIFIAMEWPIFIILVYIAIYLVYNLRRPVMVGYLGNLSPKDSRATVLSVEAQVKAIFKLLFAPVFGAIAQFWGIQWLFITLAVVVVILNWGIFRHSPE